MQVRVKTAQTVNYDGHIIDTSPSITYDGAFATWLHAVDADNVEVIEADEQVPAKTEAAPRKRAAKQVPAKTEAETDSDGDRHAN